MSLDPGCNSAGGKLSMQKGEIPWGLSQEYSPPRTGFLASKGCLRNRNDEGRIHGPRLRGRSGCRSMVGRELPKLEIGVRFPVPAVSSPRSTSSARFGSNCPRRLADSNPVCLKLKDPRTASLALGSFNGGQGGIRTHGRVSPTHAFQACSLNRSDTCPESL